MLGCEDDSNPPPVDNINVDSDWSKPFEEFEPLDDDPVTYDPVGIGVPVPSTYSGEIGYGYDVLEGDYYNVEDVKTRSIFDIDKMIQDGLILTDQAGYTENYTTTNAGKSTSEYAKEAQ